MWLNRGGNYCYDGNILQHTNVSKQHVVGLTFPQCYMSSTFQEKKENCKREHKYQNVLNRRKNICELENSNLKVPSHRRTKKESDKEWWKTDL